MSHLRSAPIRRLKHPLDESPVWSFLGSSLAIALAIAVGLPVLLVLSLLVPLCLLLRWLILSAYSSKAEWMSGNESRWLGNAWKCSVLHAVLVFEAQLEVAVLQELLLTRVVPSCPRLKHRPVSLPMSCGAHCWLPVTNFDITRHVFPGPDKHVNVQEYVSGLLLEGLSTDKPPWELHVLGQSNGHNDNTTVAVLRVHQSVADKSTLVKLLCHCLADSNTTNLRLQRGSASNRLFCWFGLLRACLWGPLTMLLWLAVSSSDTNLLTQRSAWSGQVRVDWSASIALSKLKRIVQVTRSTEHCVLLSALAGAVRGFLQNCGVRQPPNMKVVVMGEEDESSPVLMSLPTGTEGAVPRLWTTRRILMNSVRSTQPLIVYMATAALMAVLPARSARAVLARITKNKGSVQFSTVVGPNSNLLNGGHCLKSVYCLVPSPSSIGLTVSIVTYANHVYITVVTDTALGSAGMVLLEQFHTQIELLYKLLEYRRVPGEKAEHSLYRFPEMARSPVRELATRLSQVQEEVQRLSVNPETESERLSILRAEFTHLLKELRRRKRTIQSLEPWDGTCRTRRRAVSCSFARRPSLTLLSILSSKGRPASVIDYCPESPPEVVKQASQQSAVKIATLSDLSLAKKSICDNLYEDIMLTIEVNLSVDVRSTLAVVKEDASASRLGQGAFCLSSDSEEDACDELSPLVECSSDMSVTHEFHDEDQINCHFEKPKSVCNLSLEKSPSESTSSIPVIGLPESSFHHSDRCSTIPISLSD